MRKLIVTHHAPDLDAIGSCWILKKFDHQHFADAMFAFVDPSRTIAETEIKRLEVDPQDVVHVDTGLGEFDHHQPDRARQHTSASSLVYDHVCQIHPDLKNDQALKEMVDFITDIDHFGELYWPTADHYRYNFMLPQIIHGIEFIELHNDDSQLHFGFTCLEGVYSSLKQHVAAEKILKEEANYYDLQAGRMMAVETKNDDVLKLAQKNGAILAVRKDPELKHIRIKARPDSTIELKPLYEKVIKLDPEAHWYYHQSGKMLINDSRKQQTKTPSSLSLEKMVKIIQEIYG